jgi:hypothetical protein
MTDCKPIECEYDQLSSVSGRQWDFTRFKLSLVNVIGCVIRVSLTVSDLGRLLTVHMQVDYLQSLCR